VARGFGAQVELTRDHPSGSDRIAEVVERIGRDYDIVVNIQGDEPEVDPGVINRLVYALRTRSQVEMATLATPITSLAVLHDLSCVKVVCAADGRALYFSRLPIPYYRDARPEDLLRGPVDSCQLPVDSDEGATDHCQLPTVNYPSPWLLHMGLYAYRREFLLAFTKLPRSKLEQLESLEQLRALEAGASIYVEVVSHRCVGIDTAEDYARFVERQRNEGRTSKSARP
jgi:3-deoxy-manno-octulosonate cytidylyltransferase (CMP-KDO synthetase)